MNYLKIKFLLKINNLNKIKLYMAEINNNKNNFGYIQNIKNKFVFKRIFSHLTKIKILHIINYNKYCQNILNKDIDDYMEENFKIEIEIIPQKYIYRKKARFIYIPNNSKYESYFHIYFNNDKEEAKRNNLFENEKVEKIKVIIEREINSLNSLFFKCDIVKKIKFIKFNRKDITNMSHMFYRCTSLEELDISKINTDNVTDMNHMFYECLNLRILNLSNFNTDKVTNMSYMFSNCSNLTILNLSNFNTENVEYMDEILSECKSIKILNCSDTSIIVHFLKNFNY